MIYNYASLAMTSTITMINVVNAWRIKVRENKGETSKSYSEFREIYQNFEEIYRVFVDKTKQKFQSCL